MLIQLLGQWPMAILKSAKKTSLKNSRSRKERNNTEDLDDFYTLEFSQSDGVNLSNKVQLS